MYEDKEGMEGIPQEIIALCIKIQIEQEIYFLLPEENEEDQPVP